MIPGAFTASSSRAFAELARGMGVAEGHYRETPIGSISSLGIGTYLGEPDDATDSLVEEAVFRLVSSGAVNVIDTAINYRFMRAEAAVGRAIRRLVESNIAERRAILVCTKAGYLTHDSRERRSFIDYVEERLFRAGVVSPSEVAGGIHSISPRYVEWSVRKSRANTDLEVLDVVYLHNVMEHQVPVFGREATYARLTEAFAKLEDLRSEGLIGWYGLATWSSLRVERDAEEHLDLQRAVECALSVGGKNHGLRFVQLPLNVAMPEAVTLRNQEVEGELLTPVEAARKLSLVVVTSAPLLEGRLLRRVNLKPPPGMTLAQHLIQFARSASDCTLVGAKRPEHVEELIQLSRRPPGEAGTGERR
ncbi:MAG: aldo/keto reductase [Aigarchaeota archaeon]|nr:aldo/keto reductase [Candidatus Calditenuis fumarioli]